MKKVISLLLVVMMAFSAVAVGAVSVSAAEEDVAFAAGSRIFFDNTNTGWNQIYMYAWSNGYYGDFIPMEKVDFAVTDKEGAEISNANLYSVIIPQEVQNGDSYFLFTDSTDWSGNQTQNQSATTGYNTYKPSKDGKAVVKSYTGYTAAPEVAITPYSKTFTGTIDVMVYAFNLEEGQTAYYELSDGSVDEFNGTYALTLNATTTVTAEILDASGKVVTSTSCTFTKAEDAVITVNVLGGYKGDIYVYTYGGDRLGQDFNLMTKEEDGTYTYVLNGSAHVIFTTTNSWETAVKFLIYDGQELAPDQEPLVDFGQKVTFDLMLP